MLYQNLVQTAIFVSEYQGDCREIFFEKYTKKPGELRQVK